MRAIIVACIAIQIGLALPASGQPSPDATGQSGEMLPLFEKNHCGALKNRADQLFCGDPELNALSARLNRAIQDRIDRVPNIKEAIDENAEWIRNRNSSCSIFADQNFAQQDIRAIKGCLLKETE